MSLSHEAVLALMALADGELDPDARSRTEQLVASDDDARRLFEAMRASPVGAELRSVLGEGARSAGAGSPTPVVDAVMTRLGAARAASADHARAVARTAARHRTPRLGPRAVGAMTGGLFAAAAAAALVWRIAGPRPDGSARVGGGPAIVDPVASLRELEAESGLPGAGVEVDRIESASHPVSLFRIAAATDAAPGGAGSVGPARLVIWIDEESSSR